MYISTIELEAEKEQVSVPIWGLFNLTQPVATESDANKKSVSVPIWGLFNLT